MFYFNNFLNEENFSEITDYEKNEINNIKKVIKEKNMLFNKLLLLYFIALSFITFISTYDIVITTITILPIIFLLIFICIKSYIKTKILEVDDTKVKKIDANICDIIFEDNSFRVKIKINEKEIKKSFLPYNAKRVKYAPEYLVAKNGYPVKVYLISKYLFVWLPEDVKDFGEIL